jgi:hypothetical protein
MKWAIYFRPCSLVVEKRVGKSTLSRLIAREHANKESDNAIFPPQSLIPRFGGNTQNS